MGLPIYGVFWMVKDCLKRGHTIALGYSYCNAGAVTHYATRGYDFRLSYTLYVAVVSGLLAGLPVVRGRPGVFPLAGFAVLSNIHHTPSTLIVLILVVFVLTLSRRVLPANVRPRST